MQNKKLAVFLLLLKELSSKTKAYRQKRAEPRESEAYSQRSTDYVNLWIKPYLILPHLLISHLSNAMGPVSPYKMGCFLPKQQKHLI